MHIRKYYHTSIKIACKLGLLPQKLLAQIPKSTKYRFINSDYTHYFGFEEYQSIVENIDFIKELSQTKILFNTAKAIIKVKNTIIKISNNSISKFNKMKNIVSTIDNIRETISLEKAVKLFKISKSKYYSWYFQINYPCTDSIVGKCVKRWPNQITKQTIDKIKYYCSNSYFKGWPVSSIAYFCKKNSLLNLSVATWYKYANILNISKKPIKCFKKTRVGIRTNIPNHIWHVDVTIFRTNDNVKAYIYLIVDNASRFILSCKASLELSGKTRLETIKEAVSKYCSSSSNIEILVDGGSENNNQLVEDYLDNSDISIKKLIAGKDIRFSNSLVEAANKLLKYRYLFINHIPDFNSLVKHLDEFIPVYNNIRPHVSLKGLTPYEAFTGKSSHKFQTKACNELLIDNPHKNEQVTATCTVCEEN